MIDLISVIVPVFNVEKYIRPCIDSIIKQTYQNLDIILVDDGSSDNCGKICDEYMALDQRVQVIHQKNCGPSAARNTGINMVKGEYFIFVDADDVIKSNMIEVMHNVAIKQMVDLVICDYVEIQDSDDVFSFIPHTSQTNNTKIWNRYELLDQLISGTPLWGPGIVVVWNKLYKTDKFKNIQFEKGISFEDEYYMNLIYFNSERTIHIDDVLYFYRQRPLSLMRNFEKKSTFTIERKKIFSDRVDFLIDNHAPKYLIDRAIERSMNIIKKEYWTESDLQTKKQIYGFFINDFKKYKANKHMRFSNKITNLLFIYLPKIFDFYGKMKERRK